MNKEINMLSKIIFFAATLLFSIIMIGCGGTPTNSTNANTSNTNAANSGGPLETTKKPIEVTTNNAPTLTPVYKAYCAAVVKKDEAALRKLYSTDTIEYFEDQMKEDKITNLVEFLDEEASLDVCEVRNEIINGNEAVAEIRAKWAPNGIKIIFVKEGNDWKLTNRFPDAETVKQSVNKP